VDGKSLSRTQNEGEYEAAWDYSLTFNITNIATVPEPSTLGLLGVGLFGLAWRNRPASRRTRFKFGVRNHLYCDEYCGLRVTRFNFNFNRYIFDLTRLTSRRIGEPSKSGVAYLRETPLVAEGPRKGHGTGDKSVHNLEGSRHHRGYLRPT